MDRPSAVSGIKLLLVDDEETVAITLEAILREAGYAVTTCSSAEEAGQHLEGADYDIVLADLRLATLDDGLGVLRQAKQRDPDVVAVLLTGWASTQSAIDALDLGANAYLTKPCNIDQLKLTIFRGLEIRREMRSMRQKAASLEHERNFLQLVLDHAPVAISVLEGEDNRIALVNRYGLAMSGIAPEQVLGQPVGDLIPDAYSVAKPLIDKAYATGELQVIPDLNVSLPDGRQLTVESLYHSLPPSSMEERSLLTISVDVTPVKAARDEAEAARRELEELLERISDGVFALDSEWRFRFINHRALEISAAYGLPSTKEAFLGRTMWDLYPQAVGTPLYDSYQRAMRDQQPVAVNLPPNSLGMSLNVRIYPSSDGLTVFYHDRSGSVAVDRA
jgi:PAS domain S-box-containing protein